MILLLCAEQILEKLQGVMMTYDPLRNEIRSGWRYQNIANEVRSLGVSRLHQHVLTMG